MGWTVHQVAAHLIDSGTAGRLDSTTDDHEPGRLRSGQRGRQRHLRSRPEDTLAALKAAVDSTRTPPADLATRLVEAFVHGEDIRRPLDLAGDYPARGVAAALDYLVQTGVGMGGGKERVQGVRVVVSDLDWTSGSGPELSGRGIDLLLALSGRPAGAAQLSGAGLETLTASYEH